MIIEDLLYRIWRVAEFDYTSSEERQYQVDAYASIAWYVSTGRASTPWVKALVKATPKKLLTFIVLRSDGSVDSQVKSATEYLNRYCGLERFSPDCSQICSQSRSERKRQVRYYETHEV